MLFSFYPFRDESNLNHLPISRNYLAKLQQPEVLNVVNQNELVMEPFSDFVDAASKSLNVQGIGMTHFWNKRMMKLKSKSEKLLIVFLKIKTQQKRQYC